MDYEATASQTHSFQNLSFYFMRHGETEWNVLKKFQGSGNSDLTETGQQQARALGRLLKERFGSACPWTLYVSPLGRVQQTADLVQTEISFARVVTDDRLREGNLGLWEGSTIPDILRDNPHLEAEQKAHRLWLHAPQSEGLEAMTERLYAFMSERTEPALILAHGLVGKILRGLYGGVPLDEMLTLPSPQDTLWHMHERKLHKITAQDVTVPAP